MAATETATEQHVWNLLVRNVKLTPPAELRIKVGDPANPVEGPARLQIFELAVTATLASLCPDYDWHVTPNLAGDGGIDFVGRKDFLRHEGYGIAAAVTVGGQCKKRQGPVGSIVKEISGSLVDMVATLDPTFFVVALSSHLDQQRVEEARRRVELAYGRHCHILDRLQIEGLFREHLPILGRILRESHAVDGGLTIQEAQDIRHYFEQGVARQTPFTSLHFATPDHVLAGVPFSVAIDVRSTSLATLHLRWRAAHPERGGTDSVTVIAPAASVMTRGAPLAPRAPADDPLRARCELELRTHAVGDVDLGEIQVATAEHPMSDCDGWLRLGMVRVIENMRPRFFELPFRGHLKRLSAEYGRALGGGIASIGVVGAGGSGKSRLCEEFALERRRHGCAVVTAKQAKTLDDPHRLLADLFLELIDKDVSHDDPAKSVIETISLYDAALAERAGPAIGPIFAVGSRSSGAVDEQSVISALLLLAIARARQAPTVIHLQDLHWATTDVLLLLETLLWQLGHAMAASPETSQGLLFLFEGRVREQQRFSDEGWDSAPFEAFLEKLDCPTVVCSSFDPGQSLEFISRLFEDPDPNRAAADDLRQLRLELVERVNRTAGGNPFHSLEQVQLLKEQGVVGQNPQSGLLYPIRPNLSGLVLPESVFESIRLRWQYMKKRMPELALLVWALALLEDRVPTPLFRRLWRALAPEVSLADIDATDLLWTGEGREREVLFCHENYFRSLRRFEVNIEDRERTVDVYVRWFEEMEAPDPNDRFRWARILMEREQPEVARLEELLSMAAQDARERDDLRLASRILATALDFAWTRDDRSPLGSGAFLDRCGEDLALIRHLLGTDSPRAGSRIAALRERMESRLAMAPDGALSTQELRWKILVADLLEAQHHFLDNRPAQAAEVASGAVRQFEVLKPHASEDPSTDWELLEMEALHSYAVGVALSGEDSRALAISRRAVKIASRHRSALARHIECTHAAILLTSDPDEAESVLRSCLLEIGDTGDFAAVQDEANLNLTEALILRAYADPEVDDPVALLSEAWSRSYGVFRKGFQLGKYPDAGAAALLLGVICALQDDEDEVSWFAQSVAASSRGRHIETLWRAHIDFAVALHRKGEPIAKAVRDHALAAVDIMEETLSYYAEPDESKRFDLLRSPLAQATRFLLLADDEKGTALLERYPRLRFSFEDLDKCILRTDRGVESSQKWLRIGDDDYILY